MSSTDDRRFEVLRAIVADYVSHPGPGGIQGTGRASQPRSVERHCAQRHGIPRGRGLHRPTAHQFRPRPHRQGIPRIRRSHRRRQAHVRARASSDPRVLGVGCRPRRRSASWCATARATDPSGRGCPVPVAVRVVGSPPRGGRFDAGAPASRSHHRFRPRRSANRRTRRRPRRRRPFPVAHASRRSTGRQAPGRRVDCRGGNWPTSLRPTFATP